MKNYLIKINSNIISSVYLVNLFIYIYFIIRSIIFMLFILECLLILSWEFKIMIIIYYVILEVNF